MIRVVCIIKPIVMVLLPQTPSLTNLCFVDTSDPLTRHNNLLHTLCIFVNKRGSTFARVYGVIRLVLMIVVFGDRVQLLSCLVATHHTNARVRGRCCLCSLKIVSIKVE